MTDATFRKIVERAAQLATMDIHELRMFSPAANGAKDLFEANRLAAESERLGADVDEIRRVHVAEILDEEFGYLFE